MAADSHLGMKALSRVTLASAGLSCLLRRPGYIGGRGIVFDRFACLFVCFLFLCQQDYEKTAGPICMKFSGKVRSDHGTT